MSSTINAGTSGLVLTGSTTTTLSLATNGTTRATIDASGNVGIGTATPVQTLEVKSNNAFGQFTIDSAGGQYSQMFFKNNGTAVGSLFTDNSNNFLEVYGYSNVGIRFYTNNSERMRLTSAGDLGLGTTPSFLFDAYNSSTAVDYVAGRFYSAAAASGESRTWLKLEKAVNYGGAVGGYISQGIGSGLLFGTQNNASTPTERMRVDNNGNVGIGTASPGYRLHVSTSAAEISRFESTGAVGYIRVKNSTVESLLLSDVTNGVVKAGAITNHPLLLLTNDTERMRIDTSGNVSVGFTGNAGQGIFQVARTISGGGPATSGTTDANQVMVFNASSVQLGYGAYVNGTGWIQQRATANYAVNYNLVLQPNGGNVGIGTASPTQKFAVNSANTSTNSLVEYKQGDVTQAYVGMGTDNILRIESLARPTGVVAGGANYVFVTTNGSERARFSSAGGFSVGTTADPGAGAIFATGNITAYYSDARLKDFKGKIGDALYKISQLNGYYYTENAKAEEFGYNNKAMQVGVSAQEVKAVLPEIVSAAPFDLDMDGSSKSGENYMTVNYEKLVPLLIEAIKELKAEVEALKGAK